MTFRKYPEITEQQIGTMTRSEKQKVTGYIGEYLAGNALLEKGWVVYDDQHYNPYDGQKDFHVMGPGDSSAKACEVKTQRAFLKWDYFTVRPEQFEKCRNCDYLVFVSTKIKDMWWDKEGKGNPYENKIYLVHEPSQLEWKEYSRDKRDMIGVTIKDNPFIIEIAQIADPWLAKVLEDIGIEDDSSFAKRARYGNKYTEGL